MITPFAVQARWEGERLAEAVIHLKRQSADHIVTEEQIENCLKKEDLQLSPHAVEKLRQLLSRDLSEPVLLHEIRSLAWEHQPTAHSSLLKNTPIHKTNDLPLTASEETALTQVLEDFQVNENEGRCDHFLPDIGVDGSGNFILVWEDWRNTGGDIYAQRYNSQGQAQGINFKVNDVMYVGRDPDIAVDSSGNFVVVWQDNRNIEYDIYAQRYDANGNALGINFKVNDDISYVYQKTPAIAMNDSGNFVVVWEDDRNGNDDIYAKRFNAEGDAMSSDMKVNDDTVGSNDQKSPEVGIDSSGNFVVVWEDSRNENSDIYAQFYIYGWQGDNFKINDDTGSSHQYGPDIDVDDSGNFVVVWHDERNEQDDIYAQRYDSYPIELGNNFKVNDGSEGNSQRPRITMDSNGDFVVVWHDRRNGNYDIYTQCYDANGNEQGNNFIVNDDDGSSTQYNSAIAAEGNGDFVVVWVDNRKGNQDIFAQRYNASGLTLGDNFRVNDDTGSSFEYYPVIAVDDIGNFVVAWDDCRNGLQDIYAQCFDSNGNLQNNNFKVNDNAENSSQTHPSIAMKSNGDYVVVWMDLRSGDYDIYAQRFDSNGSPHDSNFKVNQDFGNAHMYPAISMDNNGNFVVVWEIPSSVNSSIYAQRYNSDGSTQGVNFRVNDDDGFTSKGDACVAMDGNGNFMVVWEDRRNGISDIYAQLYDSDGSAKGANFKVDDDTEDKYQYDPAVSVNDTGDFVVVWRDRREGNSDIYAQLYSADGNAQGVNFKVSDDTSGAWQMQPSTGIDDNGNFVVAWQDYRNGMTDNPDIYAQIFDHTAQKIDTNYRVNNDEGEKYQGFPDVKFFDKQIYYCWQDNRMEGQGYDIFARVDVKNNVPNTVMLSEPANSSYTTDNSPELAWSVPEDADNDSLHFSVEVSTDEDFSNQVSGSPFVSQINLTGFNPIPPVTAGSGECSYTLQNTLLDNTYFWRVSAWDGYSYGDASSYRQFTIDTQAPYTEGHNPAKSASGVSASVTVIVHVKDNTSGVVYDNIVMNVNGSTVTPTITGSSSDFTLTYDPQIDFGLNQTITVSIDAQDNAGNIMNTDSYSFTTVADNSAPQITHSLVTTATSGASQTVSAQLTDNGEIASATLYYRTGGSSTYSSTSMTNTAGTTYEAVIPANMVTERGVEYYFTAQDNSGNTSSIPEADPEENPQIIQVTNNNFVFSSSTAKKAYRMVSVPFDLDNSSPASVLEDDLSQYDDTRWRLLRYINGTNVEYGQSGFTNFDPGNGFWLITKESTSLDAGKGKSVTTKQNYSITLQPGWNQIGNPFTFTVNWSDVIKNENIENKLVGYYGSLNETSGFDYTQTQLVPWQGYFVNNTSSSTVTLEIPPKEASALAKNSTNVLAMYEFQDNEWGIQITAQSGNTLDKDNYIGCLDDALDQKDYHDFSQVPHFDKHISLYFPHKDWGDCPGLYTGDFREISLQGQFWDFCVTSPNAKAEVSLNLADLKNISNEWDIILIDKSSHISYNFKQKPTYTFTLENNETVRDFRILVGESQFIHANDLGMPELPKDFELSQNYPNPFNPETKINYALPSESWINISIFNLLGEQVCILKDEHQNAGRYTISWDGINRNRNRVSSGVYLLRLQTDKTTLVKKMILAR